MKNLLGVINNFLISYQIQFQGLIFFILTCYGKCNKLVFVGKHDIVCVKLNKVGKCKRHRYNFRENWKKITGKTRNCLIGTEVVPREKQPTQGYYE